MTPGFQRFVAEQLLKIKAEQNEQKIMLQELLRGQASSTSSLGSTSEFVDFGLPKSDVDHLNELEKLLSSNQLDKVQLVRKPIRRQLNNV